MIIEIPRGYTFTRNGIIIAFEENGILKMQKRQSKFDDVMCDLTYALKGRNKCYYCGKEITLKEMTLDHVYPKSLGGPTIPQNLVPSCRECNGRKENMTPEQFRSYRAIKDEEQKRMFIKEYLATKYFQERWVHILPEEWISEIPISELLVKLPVPSTNKYNRTEEYYSRCKQFRRPIVIDCHRFVLDGFIEVLYAKNNRITEIPTIILENVEVIFK